MHEEFKRIMEFFSMDSEEKAKNVNHVFEDSIEFFQRFRHIIEQGTPEEKEEIIKEVSEMQNRVKEETSKICEQTGLSEKELEQFAQDPKHYSEEQWQHITEARQRIEEEAAQIANMVKFKEQPAPQRASSVESPKKKRKKGPWVKS